MPDEVRFAVLSQGVEDGADHHLDFDIRKMLVEPIAVPHGLRSNRRLASLQHRCVFVGHAAGPLSAHRSQSQNGSLAAPRRFQMRCQCKNLASISNIQAKSVGHRAYAALRAHGFTAKAVFKFAPALKVMFTWLRRLATDRYRDFLINIFVHAYSPVV